MITQLFVWLCKLKQTNLPFRSYMPGYYKGLKTRKGNKQFSVSCCRWLTFKTEKKPLISPNTKALFNNVFYALKMGNAEKSRDNIGFYFCKCVVISSVISTDFWYPIIIQMAYITSPFIADLSFINNRRLFFFFPRFISTE